MYFRVPPLQKANLFPKALTAAAAEATASAANWAVLAAAVSATPFAPENVALTAAAPAFLTALTVFTVLVAKATVFSAAWRASSAAAAFAASVLSANDFLVATAAA